MEPFLSVPVDGPAKVSSTAGDLPGAHYSFTAYLRSSAIVHRAIG